MARAIRSSTLETRTSRLKLPVAKKPIFLPVAKGIALGYRRNVGAGTWVARCSDGKGGSWTKAFGVADDFEDSDGAKVLTFWEAQDKAKKLARGTDADAGRPVTLDEAITDYARDLAVRGAGATNATRIRKHLPPGLLAKPVSLLTVRELRHWRDDLAKDAPKSTVNRCGRALKAALNLAAAQDDRIANTKSWRVGLAALGEDDDTDSNVVLTDQQRRDVVAAAYRINREFGLYTEVHASVGARSSQIALLNVGDLQMNGGAARLMVPSSLKGRGRSVRTRKPVPIPPGLAAKLHAAADGRAAGEPLLLNKDGKRWRDGGHYWPFVEAAEAAKLPEGASIYCLRHTSITRMLLANVPVRLVASLHDTSISQIEKTYSKYIADHADALLRRGLFDLDTPEGRNVIPLVPTR